MKVERILEEISVAKLSYLQWLDRARLLVEGSVITREYLPVDATFCDFGHWFYEKSEHPLPLLGSLSMGQLESKHKFFHNTYREIFQIYSEGASHASLLESEKVFALEELIYLEAITNELMGYLNMLEENFNLMMIEGSLERVS
jgi:hypothetical protein